MINNHLLGQRRIKATAAIALKALRDAPFTFVSTLRSGSPANVAFFFGTQSDSHSEVSGSPTVSTVTSPLTPAAFIFSWRFSCKATLSAVAM